jgi:signal transduction histidine kinase
VRPLRAALIAVLVGFVMAAVIASATGATAFDALRLIAFAALGSGAAVIVFTVLLRRFRGRRMRTQILFVALAATVITTAGVVLAASQMFISDHDLSVLAVVVVTSAAVSVGAALAVGAEYERSVEQVGRIANQLAPVGDDAAPAPSELDALAARLSEVSELLDASRARELALEESRRELIAGVSHDLRSPIASIRAMAEALEDGVVVDDTDAQRYHRAIRIESERLGDLVDDLFELSRITAGVCDTEQPVVELDALVDDVMTAAESAARTKGVYLVNLLDDVPSVRVPASDLRRVLHNLLDNAIRHTVAHGTVLVEGAVNGRLAELRVIDECGGIPEADLARVFEVAFRGDAARSRDTGGGGLGLAIAKGLVEAHHGSIELTNRAPGCCFTLRLPVLPA